MKILHNNYTNMTYEDVNVATDEVEPTIENTNLEIEEIEPTIEEIEPTIEDVNLEIEGDKNDETDLDLESIINDLDEENEEVEEIPTKPTFFPNNDSNDLEEEEIDEKFLDELDESFWELETEIGVLREQIKIVEEERDNAKEEALLFWKWLDIISEHPVLGPLSAKLLNGEELNIPEILTKSLEEDINELPNMENIANEPTEVNTPLSLQDKLSRRVSQMY